MSRHRLATDFCVALDIEATSDNIVRFVRGIRDTSMEISLGGNTRCCVDGTSRGPCKREAFYQSRVTVPRPLDYATRSHLDYCEHHAARVSWMGVLSKALKDA